MNGFVVSPIRGGHRYSIGLIEVRVYRNSCKEYFSKAITHVAGTRTICKSLAAPRTEGEGRYRVVEGLRNHG